MIATHIRLLGALAATVLIASTACAAPAMGTRARLQRCGGETCLLVTGSRPDAAAPVALAGHDVAVQGMRRWRVALPLRTVQAWSAPSARSIAVRIAGVGEEIDVPLPIGLLGHGIELASLEVRAR